MLVVTAVRTYLLHKLSFWKGAELSPGKQLLAYGTGTTKSQLSGPPALGSCAPIWHHAGVCVMFSKYFKLHALGEDSVTYVERTLNGKMMMVAHKHSVEVHHGRIHLGLSKEQERRNVW